VLVVSAGYCVMWFVRSLYFILVLVVVFVLGVSRNSTSVHPNKESDSENA